MPENTQKVSEVTAIHKQLSALCDTGFAVACHIRYTRPSLLYRTYSKAWIDHYSAQGYMLSDPVVHWGLANTGRVMWSDLAGQDPAGVLPAAKAHGLQNGWTYSTGKPTSRTISGHTRSGPAYTEAEFTRIASLIEELHRLTEGFDTLDPRIQESLRALG